MSTEVAASSQLFYSLATLVIMKARPRPAEDKMDELVELCSEHMEGTRAEVTRYGTKETKYQKKLCWGLEPNNPWEYDALAVLMSMIGKKS